MKNALDLPKVCDALSVSKTTLYELINLGEFPKPFRIGRSSRWSSQWVDDYISRKEQEPDVALAEPESLRKARVSA